jgi:hypothetical protein
MEWRKGVKRSLKPDPCFLPENGDLPIVDKAGLEDPGCYSIRLEVSS